MIKFIKAWFDLRKKRIDSDREYQRNREIEQAKIMLYEYADNGAEVISSARSVIAGMAADCDVGSRDQDPVLHAILNDAYSVLSLLLRKMTSSEGEGE